MGNLINRVLGFRGSFHFNRHRRFQLKDYAILKFLIGNYLKVKFNIDDSKYFCRNHEPPYLLISNHVTNYDPFILGAFTNYPLYFVASDRQFIHPIKSFFLKRYGTIPKTKFKSDTHAIKKIKKVVDQKGVIALFPEGKRNWDGCTDDLVFATAKLIKLLNIDVIGAKIKGGYLSHPRWASCNRRGKVTLFSEVLIRKEAVQSMTLEEVFEIIRKGISHDEYEFQGALMSKFKGSKLAEKLELALFICPNCKRIDSMRSKGNHLSCISCESAWQYDEYGFLISNSHTFTTIKDWNNWQIGFLKACLQENDGMIHAENVRFFTSSRLKPFVKGGKGKIKIENEIFIINSNKRSFETHISDIDGINVQSNDILEFYHGEKLYRFVFNDGYSSAYKWVLSLNIIKKDLRNNDTQSNV